MRAVGKKREVGKFQVGKSEVGKSEVGKRLAKLENFFEVRKFQFNFRTSIVGFQLN